MNLHWLDNPAKRLVLAECETWMVLTSAVLEPGRMAKGEPLKKLKCSARFNAQFFSTITIGAKPCNSYFKTNHAHPSALSAHKLTVFLNWS